MRSLLLALAVVGACTGVALAQAQSRIFQAEFEASPTAQIYVRNYPHAALNSGQSGFAHLCCTVNDDRTLDCQVAREWPSGAGFGTASATTARTFRLTPASYAAFRSDPSRLISRTIVWRLDGVDDAAFEAELARVRDHGVELCAALAAPVS